MVKQRSEQATEPAAKLLQHAICVQNSGTHLQSFARMPRCLHPLAELSLLCTALLCMHALRHVALPLQQPQLGCCMTGTSLTSTVKGAQMTFWPRQPYAVSLLLFPPVSM